MDTVHFKCRKQNLWFALFLLIIDRARMGGKKAVRELAGTGIRGRQRESRKEEKTFKICKHVVPLSLVFHPTVYKQTNFSELELKDIPLCTMQLKPCQNHLVPSM